MDEEFTKAFAGIMVVLGEMTHTMDQRFDAVDKRFDAIDKRLDEMATKAQHEAVMARMNDGFERVLDSTHALRKNNDSTQETLVTLGQRVTRLEDDVRRLRGGV